MNKKRKTGMQLSKEQEFKMEIEKLFDISRKSALIKVKEDAIFLQDQKTTRAMYVGDFDKKYNKKIKRKEQREKQKEIYNERQLC